MNELVRLRLEVELMLMAAEGMGADDEWEAGYYDGQVAAYRTVLDTIEEIQR